MDINYYYLNTELSQREIANKLGLTLNHVNTAIRKQFSSEFRRQRKVVSYKNSKLGDKNPMYGNKLELHPRYKILVSDNKGYLMRVKPLWYTGRINSKYVFEHHIVVCQQLGLTQIPKGWCVHHCDMNPHNNDFSNLVLLTMSNHRKLHSYLEGATTISKESTLKWVEAHGTPWRRDDIVSSTQECVAGNGQGITTLVEDK